MGAGSGLSNLKHRELGMMVPMILVVSNIKVPTAVTPHNGRKWWCIWQVQKHKKFKFNLYIEITKPLTPWPFHLDKWYKASKVQVSNILYPAPLIIYPISIQCMLKPTRCRWITNQFPRHHPRRPNPNPHRHQSRTKWSHDAPTPRRGRPRDNS